MKIADMCNLELELGKWVFPDFKIEAGKTYDLDLVCDGSVCVLYVNGKVALSNRIYGMRGQKWGLITQTLNATYSIPLLTK